ncbi:hypothetical protein Q5O24_06930 [Eubacteriaceae bacterium ES3]|nr:hypothetical protein Q5O24_06930 [Eubacteriaceae bacterium ES3]
MALDNKLKSEMASGTTYPKPNRTTSVPDSNGTRPVFESSAQETQTEEAQIAPKAVPVACPSACDEAQNATELLLKSIEKQLKSLNQSVADLEQEVSSCKNPDYRVMFSEIDSARCSIEKMLSGVNAAVSPLSDSGLAEKIAKLETLITAVSEKQDRNDRQLAQSLRENANFQIQVRQGMQKDIDALKEQQSGEQFNPIFKEIASMYVEYQGLLEDEGISDLSRKNLNALFEQMEDLLTDYDAEITRSEIGDIRQTKSTKIIGKVPTAAQDKHNTIAISRKPGVLRGRSVLYPEFVDVFVFDPTIAPKEINDTTAMCAEKTREAATAEDEITENISGTTSSDIGTEREPLEVTEEATSECAENKEITVEDTDQTNE